MVDAILHAAGRGPVKGSIPKGAAWFAGAVLELIYRILNLKGEPQMTRFAMGLEKYQRWTGFSLLGIASFVLALLGLFLFI